MSIQIDLPATQQAFYKEQDQKQLEAKLKEIGEKYAAPIAKLSKISNIPAELITSFIFIESGGKADIVSGSKAVGLMQVKSSSASDVVILENRRGRLSDDEKAILIAKLGKDRATKLINAKVLSQAQVITDADMKDPEFNLLIGTMYLGMLIDEHTEQGKVRMDKVISRYNQGYFYAGSGKKLTGTIDEVLTKLPKEAKAYVLKMVGKYGTLKSLVSKQ